MRPVGKSSELERRRRLAIDRIRAGEPVNVVARDLGVDPSSVRRWRAAFRQCGDDGLRARPVPGRPQKLTSAQVETVRRWFNEGIPRFDHWKPDWDRGMLWAAIGAEWKIDLHPGYITRWMRKHGLTFPAGKRRARIERPRESR